MLLRRKQKIRELTRPDARNQAGTILGLDGLRKGLEELLRLLSDARGPASSGGMDTTSVAIHDLDGDAGSSGTDSYVNAGLLRHSLHKQRVGRTVHGGWRTARPCPSRFRSSASTLWVFLGCSRVLRSPLNRPMRTRMSGGAAEESERLPLCRFHEELLTLRTLFGVTVVGKACVTGCYFLAIATEARVVSQSIFSVAPFPVFANEIAKFSTGEGSVRLSYRFAQVVGRPGIIGSPFPGFLADDQSPLVRVRNREDGVIARGNGCATNGDIGSSDKRGGFIRARAPHFSIRREVLAEFAALRRGLE